MKYFGDSALAEAKDINEDRMMALALLLPSVIGDRADDIVIEVMNRIIKSGRAPQVMASLAAQTGHLLRLEWGEDHAEHIMEDWCNQVSEANRSEILVELFLDRLFSRRV
ncbi:hypothetical protein EB72_24720 [Mycobacterium sp. SWH-M1]|nr:hypothetical protein EB72_24720 [Mycobacterium sp. SWH-M1]